MLAGCKFIAMKFCLMNKEKALRSVLAVTHVYVVKFDILSFKAAYSVTLNIFEKFYFLFKSFVKVELSYVFTIKMFSTAENCMEK